MQARRGDRPPINCKITFSGLYIRSQEVPQQRLPSSNHVLIIFLLNLSHYHSESGPLPTRIYWVRVLSIDDDGDVKIDLIFVHLARSGNGFGVYLFCWCPYVPVLLRSSSVSITFRFIYLIRKRLHKDVFRAFVMSFL